MSGAGLRRHVVAGLIVIAPVGVTVYVLWWIFQLLDGVLGGFLYPVLPVRVPGLGLLALFGLLVAVGWLAERAVGGRFIAWWDGLLETLPLTRSIYGASSRIVRTVLGRDRRPFRQVVLFEYPAAGRWSIGFVAATAPAFARHVVPEGSVTIFMPTTPNPTTGYLVTVARESVVPIDLTVEEAFTYVLSAGTVAPPEAVVAAGPGASGLGGRPATVKPTEARQEAGSPVGSPEGPTPPSGSGDDEPRESAGAGTSPAPEAP